MKIQLKRSNQLEGGEAKKPSVAQMEYGELAVNYNTEDPALFIKDSADQIVKLKIAPAATVLIADTAPDINDSDIGTLWWNSSEDSGQLFILYDDPSGGGGGDAGGPKWIEASPTAGGSGAGGAEVLVSETAPVIDDLEEGSLWWNSSSTDLQLYVLYNDNGTKKWVEASPTVGDAGSEDDFVNVTGDNMTGNLTLGTDKITLDASNGTATFVGGVDSSDFLRVVNSDPTVDTSGSLISKGLFRAIRASGTGAGTKVFEGYSAETLTSSIGMDGSAEFAGDVVSDGRLKAFGGTANNGGTDISAGSITVRQDGSGNDVFTILRGSETPVVLKSDGSADFKDTVEAKNFEAYRGTTNAGDPLFIGYSDVGSTKNLKCQITADGSATFEGAVEIGNNSLAGTVLKVTGTGTSVGNYNISSHNNFGATFTVARDGSVGIGGLGSVAPTYIKSDGSAKFMSNITLGGEPINAASRGTQIFSNGGIASTRSDDSYLFRGYRQGNSTATSVINADGTATFAGNITAGNVTFNLEPDNPANYTTATDIEGNEINVYNGPTLNIKDRIQNLISRLDSLESDEITDDATSTLLLTTVNNINAQMTKVNNALTAIRAAANAAGTLDQLKTDIAAATADI